MYFEPKSRALGEFKVQVLEGLLRVVSLLGIGASFWALVGSPFPLRRSLVVVLLFSPVHLFAWLPRLGHRVRSDRPHRSAHTNGAFHLAHGWAFVRLPRSRA